MENLNFSRSENSYEEKVAQIKQEIGSKLQAYITQKILDGTQTFWESDNDYDHGHLDYQDDNYWGHYILPKENGVDVTVYEKKDIHGDPMDIEGKRGTEYTISIPLAPEVMAKIPSLYLK